MSNFVVISKFSIFITDTMEINITYTIKDTTLEEIEKSFPRDHWTIAPIRIGSLEETVQDARKKGYLN